MSFRNMTVVAALLMFGASALWAADAKSDDRKQDEEAIRATAQAYLEALERGDAKAAAEYWVPGGDIVDPSRRSRPAREALAEGLKAAGKDKRPEIKITSSSIRFLTDDSAIEDGTSQITPPEASAGAPIKGHFSAVWVRQQGKWRLASLRESGAATPSFAGPGDHLAALEPMVGLWSAQVGNRLVAVSVEWNSTHTFLLREMKVLDGDKVVMTAHQRVGWDPATGQIKSWAFDSYGGHGEGVWTREGDAWHVRNTGTLSNGTRTTATNTYSFDGPNTLEWKSQGTRENGRPHDLEMKLVRHESSHTAAVPASHASAPSDPAKTKILESPRWRRAMFELNEWLSSQDIYDAQQVEAIKRSFTSKVANSSATELEFMLNDMDAKFKILETPEARESRAWLAQYLSILSDKRRDEIVKQLPNITTMTASQLAQEMAKLNAQRETSARRQAQATPRPVATINPWDPAPSAAQTAYTREHMPSSQPAYYSPYSAGNGEPPFSDANPNKMDFGMYVGAGGQFGLIW